MLPQSDTEAFLWAQKAAEGGLVKAMYAVGYFLEVGIGTEPDISECVYPPPLPLTSDSDDRATAWYKRAADQGDKRAAQRLRGGQAPAPGAPGAVLQRDAPGAPAQAKKDKDCTIM